MNYEDKLKLHPEESVDHERFNQLNSQLAVKLAQLRNAGVDVDNSAIDISNPANQQRVRNLILSSRKEFQAMVKPQQNGGGV